MKSIARATVLFLAALAPSVRVAQQPTPASTQAGTQAQPQTLALQDLVNRPERWPATVRLKKDFQFSGAAAKAGQEVKVVEFNGAKVGLDAGNSLVFEASPSDCDLLEAANQVWATLTPAQRAVEPATLLKDASLWPERAICTSGFRLDDGSELAPNGEYEFLTLEDDGVHLYSAQQHTTLVADLAQTDVVARARKLALVEPEKRPSRISAALGKTLVDAAGKPVSSAAIDNASVYVLYFGASWCGPCRKFSPSLVKFMNDAATKYPRLATVLMSNDKDDDDMRGYMTDEKMPWPAMPLKAIQKAPLLMSYSCGSIPHLVVVDRHGLVLASSVQNGQYVGPDSALKKLSKLLESGIAR